MRGSTRQRLSPRPGATGAGHVVSVVREAARRSFTQRAARLERFRRRPTMLGEGGEGCESDESDGQFAHVVSV